MKQKFEIEIEKRHSENTPFTEFNIYNAVKSYFNYKSLSVKETTLTDKEILQQGGIWVTERVSPGITIHYKELGQEEKLVLLDLHEIEPFLREIKRVRDEQTKRED